MLQRLDYLIDIPCEKSHPTRCSLRSLSLVCCKEGWVCLNALGVRAALSLMFSAVIDDRSPQSLAMIATTSSFKVLYTLRKVAQEFGLSILKWILVSPFVITAGKLQFGFFRLWLAASARFTGSVCASIIFTYFPFRFCNFGNMVMLSGMTRSLSY